MSADGWALLELPGGTLKGSRRREQEARAGSESAACQPPARAAVCSFTIFAGVASLFLSKTMSRRVAVSVVDAIQGRGAG